MDWKFITHHLLSDYILMLAATALYFIFLHMIMGSARACMKQKCFRTSRAFYLVSVILSKKIKCFSRELSWGAGYWWLVEGRDIFPPLNLEN
jgi:hypothetical protein